MDPKNYIFESEADEGDLLDPSIKKITNPSVFLLYKYRTRIDSFLLLVGFVFILGYSMTSVLG